jgi:hypothetical protein
MEFASIYKYLICTNLFPKQQFGPSRQNVKWTLGHLKMMTAGAKDPISTSVYVSCYF